MQPSMMSLAHPLAAPEKIKAAA